MSPIRSLAVTFSLALGLGAGSAGAAPAPPQPPVVDFHPSLGDTMTMLVQPRHIKLGVGGRARNWAYVAYEASELRNAFGRVSRTIPIYRQNKLADLFAAGAVPALDRLDAAIKAKNARKFDAAYRDLTQTCNACHSALDHPYVVIRAPLSSPYADQDFKRR